MKILTVTSNHPPYHAGGYELRVKDIMDCLTSRKHEILVLTTKTMLRYRSNGLPSLYPVKRVLHSRHTARFFPREVLVDLVDTKALESVIKEFQPDVIYLGHTYILSKAILPYLNGLTIPIIYDEGGTGLKGAWTENGRWYQFCRDYKSSFSVLNKLKPFVIKLVLLLGKGRIKSDWRWPDNLKVFFNSHGNLNHSLSFGVPVQAAKVIHSGIDLDKFQFTPHTRVEQPIKILCPGRLEPRKGQVDAIELVSMLSAVGIKAELTLVGESSSRSYLEQVISKINSEGLQQSVRMFGMVDQVKLSKLYQGADICFFSSHHPTGFSRTPLEAMASGCVVISYGSEGSDEIIENGKSGYIIDQGNINGACEIVNQLLDDPMSFNRIVHNARKLVEEKFDFDSYINSIQELIIQAVRESN